MGLPCACSSSGTSLPLAQAFSVQLFTFGEVPVAPEERPGGPPQGSLCLPPFLDTLTSPLRGEGKRYPIGIRALGFAPEGKGPEGEPAPRVGQAAPASVQRAKGDAARVPSSLWLSELWHKNCTEITVGQFLGIFQRWKDVFGEPNQSASSSGKCAKAGIPSNKVLSQQA